MAVPKKKVSKSKRNTRRAHDAISKLFISVDSVTGEPKLPHHISLKDGYYNGKQLVRCKNEKKKEQQVVSKKQSTKAGEDKKVKKT